MRLHAPLLLLLSSTTAAQSTCGSLITYRQYSVLLSNAPPCFQNGCGGPPPARSMSSTCSVTQSCSHLWELLRAQWQTDQCTTECQSDLACRIPGWPVLNMTRTCTTVPEDWLFSSNNTGACCASGSEPFALADWVGGLCNGSEWRSPFAYYGGMAREDWEEWIAPWNWTVRQHDATQGENCPNSDQILTTFALENVVTSFELVFSIAVFWFAAITNRSRHYIRFFGLPAVNSWKRAVLLGIWYPLCHWLASSFWSAALIRLEPGYQDVPVGLLALLLCARPNSLMVVTCILLWLNKLIPHQFEERMLNTMIGPDTENYGRQYSKRLISILGLWVSVSEILVQGLGAYSVFKTTDQGVKKGFFIAGRLVPYWRGNDAMIMYAGALVHSTVAFLAALCLYLSAYCHAQEARFHQKLFHILDLLWIPQNLNRHFTLDEQHEQQRQAPEMAQAQAQGSTGQLVPTKESEGLVPNDPRTLIIAGEMGTTTISAVETPSGTHIVLDTAVLRFYVWLVGEMPTPIRDQYPALQRAIDGMAQGLHNQTPEWATLILLLTTFFAVTNFIAQWLFWAGFVKMQGPRFCPPEDPGLIRDIRLIFSLLPLTGLIPPTLLSAAEALGFFQA